MRSGKGGCPGSQAGPVAKRPPALAKCDGHLMDYRSLPARCSWHCIKNSFAQIVSCKWSPGTYNARLGPRGRGPARRFTPSPWPGPAASTIQRGSPEGATPLARGLGRREAQPRPVLSSWLLARVALGNNRGPGSSRQRGRRRVRVGRAALPHSAAALPYHAPHNAASGQRVK